MATKPVAVTADVSATPGTTPYTGAKAGAWTAGPVVPQEWGKLIVGGAATLHEARCTFAFSGTAEGGAAVAGTSEVTLSASATKMQGGSNNVLRDGDHAQDSYGNTLAVVAAGKLRSG